MQHLTIAGNVGKDAELRTAGTEQVLNFSIAVDNGKDRDGQKRPPTWYDCAIWGKRAESLAGHITKGSKLALNGAPTVRVHDGKAYLGIRVDGLTFMGGSSDRDEASPRGESNDAATFHGRGYGQGPRADLARQAPAGRGPSLDDEIPFGAEIR